MDDAHLEADRIFGPCNDPCCPGGAGATNMFSPAPRPVTLTRRTAQFGAIAGRVEECLAQLGIIVDPKGIDADLRERVRAVADQLGVSDRTALRYAPDDLAEEIAQQIKVAAWSLMDTLGYDRPRRKRHLQLVK